MIGGMGGNGSYSKAYRGVPNVKRTHIDTNMRIDGHKVLLQKGNARQSKNIMNSNSENPIYIIARDNGDGTVVVHSVNVFKDHKISLEINFKYDANGNMIPYSANSEKGSHAHHWYVNDSGEYHRKQHDTNNVFNIPSECKELVKHIDEFNKKKRKWEK